MDPYPDPGGPKNTDQTDPDSDPDPQHCYIGYHHSNLLGVPGGLRTICLKVNPQKMCASCPAVSIPRPRGRVRIHLKSNTDYVPPVGWWWGLLQHINWIIPWVRLYCRNHWQRIRYSAVVLPMICYKLSELNFLGTITLNGAGTYILHYGTYLNADPDPLFSLLC